jgi:uroporphyrinogen-III decarboxylase
MTLVGGTNALSLRCGDPNRIRDEVRQAIDVLGATNRFILHPVDAIFPDTPWSGVQTMIDAWKECQSL